MIDIIVVIAASLVVLLIEFLAVKLPEKRSNIKFSKRERVECVKLFILRKYRTGYIDYTSGILKFKNIPKYVLKETSFYRYRNDYNLLITQVESDFFRWIFKNPDKSLYDESLERYILNDSNIVYDEIASDPLLEKYLNSE